jgi:hypothetical protein
MGGEWQLTILKPEHKVNRFALTALIVFAAFYAAWTTGEPYCLLGIAAPYNNSSRLFRTAYHLIRLFGLINLLQLKFAHFIKKYEIQISNFPVALHGCKTSLTLTEE